jgi:type II secretory pathway pseudopilin PulG
MRRRNGFTLIVLLVGIAVIAVVMAILMPSLCVAREQARSVQRDGNVRTATPAGLMYKDDHDGRRMGSVLAAMDTPIARPTLSSSREPACRRVVTALCASRKKIVIGRPMFP